METNRRTFIKNSTFAAIGSMAAFSLANNAWAEESPMQDGGHQHLSFELPPLPYAYDALEPHIDKMTMEIHHTKHHQAYVNNLNKALQESHVHAGSLEELLANISHYPAAIRNNGGGHWNHDFFWKLMKSGGGGAPTGKVAEAINQSFGSFDEFKKQLGDAGLKRFGSGWAWLVKSPDGKLVIGSTPNQDNPLMDVSELKGKPIMGVDVWEHAYYLKYQNKRGDYLAAWWNVVNWEQVAANLG
ncbi:MAG: superoxide dismutase [Bacteroidota bacterium]